MTAIKVSEATKEQVQAALEMGHLREVVIFCDQCGIEMATDMIGETPEERIDGARKWLRDRRGWTEADGRDICTVCVAGVRTCMGPYHHHCEHGLWVWQPAGYAVHPEDLEKHEAALDVMLDRRNA